MRSGMRAFRRWALAAMAILALAPAIAAAPGEPGAEPELETLVHTLRYQPAQELLPLLLPLVSQRGAVELRAGGNTLVVRDEGDVLAVIRSVIAQLDHPLIDLDLSLRLVRAALGALDAGNGPPLPPGLARELGELLPYRSYELVAETAVRIREGEKVTYSVGDLYEVHFRVGTVLPGRRLYLHDFELNRAAGKPAASRERSKPTPPQRLKVNLYLDKTNVIGLSGQADGDRALMVVLQCRLADSADPQLR